MIDLTSVKSCAAFSGTANLKKRMTCTPTVVNGHLIVKSSVAISETGKKRRNTCTLTLGNGHFSVKSCATFCCVVFSENDTLTMYMCTLVNDHLGVKC